MAAGDAGVERHGRLARVRLAPLAAVVGLLLLPLALGAQSESWVGWDLECETSRIPVGDEAWRWTWMDGLAPAIEDGRPLARLADGASLLLLLRDGSEPRTVYLEARAEGGNRELALSLNGVELGARTVARKWRMLEYPVPVGTLRHGPNVVRLELAGERSRKGDGVLLDRIAVEPAAFCENEAAATVDPEADNTLRQDVAVVAPGSWEGAAELSLRMATQWPSTALAAYCFDETSSRLLSTLTGGPSRRLDAVVPLTGPCATGRGLVLLATGPGWLELRRARLGAPAASRTSLLGWPLVAAFALVAVALAAGSRLAARARPAAAPARGGFSTLGAVGSLARRALESPFVWVLAVLWTWFIATLERGELWPQRVADTVGYESLLQEGARDGLLAFSRTMGYSTFLYLTGWELWGIQKVAIAQALFLAAAIVVFWLGVRAYAGSGWLALAAALPLAWSPLTRIVRRVQPDFMGGAMSLVAIALLVLLASAPRRSRWLWAALAATVFAAYQIRPAAVFLIGFVPLAAALLWVVRHGLEARDFRRFLLASLLAALGPFLLYAGLRWLTVGHFGLVSYGGFNVIGVTAPMLDEELVASLPEDLEPLAAAILEEKKRQGLPVYEAGTPLDFWFDNYNRHVWDIAVPVARRLYEPEGVRPLGQVEINDAFTELSYAVILRQPFLYLDWVVRSFAKATMTALGEPWIHWPLAAVAAGAIAWVSRGRRDVQRLRPLIGLLAVALVFYTVHLLLVVAVEETLERYYVATVFLIPGALCALAFGLWREPFEALGRRLARS